MSSTRASRVLRRCRRFAIALTVAVATAGAATSVVAAGSAIAPDDVRAVRYGANPVDQIIEQVERRYRAHVVRVGEEEVNGRRVYVLRLLSEQGRVWTVRVDAESGREL